MMADDDGPPTLRQKRRTEHLGTENVVNRNLFWRKAKGTILHAVAYQTIVRQDTPWTLQQPFTRYVNGHNQEELPEVKHLEVPDEDGLDYCTGVALATFDGVPVELSFGSTEILTATFAFTLPRNTRMPFWPCTLTSKMQPTDIFAGRRWTAISISSAAARSPAKTCCSKTV